MKIHCDVILAIDFSFTNFYERMYWTVHLHTCIVLTFYTFDIIIGTENAKLMLSCSCLSIYDNHWYLDSTFVFFFSIDKEVTDKEVQWMSYTWVLFTFDDNSSGLSS